MTQEEKAKAYDEALERARKLYNDAKANEYKSDMEDYESIFPELAESEDERIRKCLCDIVNWLGFDSSFFLCNGVAKTDVLAYLEKQKDINCLACDQHLKGYLAGRKVTEEEKQKEQKPIKMEVYEVGKGTTICGQDYKCKKDYKEGNCWYIKDVVYHCSRDGYLTDQHGISWSCTPEWFNEYTYTNSEWADKEKNDFVSGQFLRCKLSFDGFKEGEHYWLEYVGNDMYVGRSDNILNQKFHITPRQLFTLFSQELEEVQGPPQEEKQVSLNYEPPFDENPSDKEIVEALIKHLKEQDGFLTAIDSVSTKAILSWLEKQKEQNSVDEQFPPLNGLDAIKAKYYDDGFKNGFDEGVASVKPAEWSEEDETALGDLMWCIEQARKSAKDENDMGNIWFAENWVKNRLKSLRPQSKPEWSEEDEKKMIFLERLIEHNVPDGQYGWVDGRKGGFVTKSEAISMLKSLRPRYHGDVTMTEAYKMGKEAGEASSWKPSEEDLMMLEHIIGQYEIGNKNSKVMGYLPRIEELDFLKKVLAKWKN